MILGFFSSQQLIGQQIFSVSHEAEIWKVIAPDGKQHLTFPQENGWLKALSMEIHIKSKLGAYHFREKKVKAYEAGMPVITKFTSESAILVGWMYGKRDSCRYRMEVKAENGKPGFGVKITTECTATAQLQLTLKRDPGKPVYGLGAQPSFANLDEKALSVFCEEQGIGRGDRPVTRITRLIGAAGNAFTSYFPVPVFYDPAGKGAWVENWERTQFDFETPDRAGIQVDAPEMRMRVLQEENPAGFLKAMTAETGRQAPLPDWSYQPTLGIQGGIAQVDSILQILYPEGASNINIWVQDWVGKRKTAIGSRLWWDWEPDTLTYPDFRNWVEKKKAAGIRVLGYMNPFLAPEGKLGRIAAEKGYIVHNAKGEPYAVAAGGFNAYLLDLSNPETVEWIKAVIQTQLIGNGLSGWMADFGEWLPMDAVLANGTPAEWHNRYPVEWARVNREAIAEAGKTGEIMFFNRSGYLGSSEYATAFWAGDQTLDFEENDGMPSALSAILSAGLSGAQINHADAGGYTNIHIPFLDIHRDVEVYARGMELAAFSPIFRTHEGLQPARNIQPWTDSTTMAIWHRMAALRTALKPCIDTAMAEIAETGLPILRHMAITFPEDTTACKLDRQFMLGNDILVIPVLERGKTTQSGYVPEGNWISPWDEKTISGPGIFTFPAEIGKPVFLVRAGGKCKVEIEELSKVR